MHPRTMLLDASQTPGFINGVNIRECRSRRMHAAENRAPRENIPRQIVNRQSGLLLPEMASRPDTYRAFYDKRRNFLARKRGLESGGRETWNRYSNFRYSANGITPSRVHAFNAKLARPISIRSACRVHELAIPITDVPRRARGETARVSRHVYAKLSARWRTFRESGASSLMFPPTFSFSFSFFFLTNAKVTDASISCRMQSRVKRKRTHYNYRIDCCTFPPARIIRDSTGKSPWRTKKGAPIPPAAVFLSVEAYSPILRSCRAFILPGPFFFDPDNKNRTGRDRTAGLFQSLISRSTVSRR